MNLEDIKKLTVADLKKELKVRNLTVSGNKTELLQRLSDHIASNEEQQILQTGGRIDDSLLEGVHEDEVLGISPGGNVSAIPLTPAAKKAYKVEASAPAKQQLVKVSGTAAVIGAVSPPPAKATVQKSPTEPETVEAEKILLKPSVSSDSDAEPKTTLKVAVAVLDPDQAKIDRAKKFNVPLSEADRKKLRADRFGTDQKSKTTAASVSSSKVALDPEMLKKRAERFGIPVAAKAASSSAEGADAEKLKQRMERFGLQNKQEKTSQGTNGVGSSGGDIEKLLKRRMRFGGGAATSSSGDATEKKKARAARFGTGTSN